MAFSNQLKYVPFASATVYYLGHVVGNCQVRAKTANVEVILSFPTPSNRTILQNCLGMAGFYRWFLKNCSPVLASLIRLTSPKNYFKVGY